MPDSATKRVLIIGAALISLLCIACLLYLFLPPQPRAKWDSSPGARVIRVGYIGEVDLNHIDAVRVWGDGHVVWVEYDASGKRRVLEGRLSEEELAQLIDRLIDAGFFEGYRRSERWDIRQITPGETLEVSLSNVQRQLAVSPGSGYDNRLVLDLVGFLKSGAGTSGADVVPVKGVLFAYPAENVGIHHPTQASYHWPGDEFGYGLQQVYADNQEKGVQVADRELAFVWEIVNQPYPLVESDGQVFWIAVRVPGIHD